MQYTKDQSIIKFVNRIMLCISNMLCAQACYDICVCHTQIVLSLRAFAMGGEGERVGSNCQSKAD